MTRVIILCAGQASRWAPKTCKQLVSIDGEPLLHRTVRLLRRFGYNDIHIAHHNPQLHVEGCQHFTPSDSRWITDTLLSSRHLWTDRTIVLLGDVYFTEDALQQILECTSAMQFVGRLGASSYTGCPYGEIFGLLFLASAHGKLTTTLREAIAETEQLHRSAIRHAYTCVRLYPKRFFRCMRKGNGVPMGTRIRKAHNHAKWEVRAPRFLGRRLWNIYCKWAGLSLRDRTTDTAFFMYIDDFTEDFDMLSDYTLWLAKYTQQQTPTMPRHSVATSVASL